MRDRTCCFTGNRVLPVSAVEDIKRSIDDIIEKLVSDGIDTFLCGGALGFDMLAEEAVLSAKKRHPELKLVLFIPCLGHDAKWKNDERERLSLICERADRCVVLSENYFSGCMQQRNRCMVDESSVCVAYSAKKTGGTAYTVDYARFQGVRVIDIAPQK